MLCVWNPDDFAGVVDYDTWESELCEDEDILRHIKAGAFVPVGIHRGLDGVFGVHLRVGECAGGDPTAAQERLHEIDPLPLLSITDEIRGLAAALTSSGAVPASEPRDALHIAVAAVHGVHFW